MQDQTTTIVYGLEKEEVKVILPPVIYELKCAICQKVCGEASFEAGKEPDKDIFYSDYITKCNDHL